MNKQASKQTVRNNLTLSFGCYPSISCVFVSYDFTICVWLKQRIIAVMLSFEPFLVNNSDEPVVSFFADFFSISMGFEAIFLLNRRTEESDSLMIVQRIEQWIWTNDLYVVFCSRESSIVVFYPAIHIFFHSFIDALSFFNISRDCFDAHRNQMPLKYFRLGFFYL